jgi:hypothetical protein
MAARHPRECDVQRASLLVSRRGISCDDTVPWYLSLGTPMAPPTCNRGQSVGIVDAGHGTVTFLIFVPERDNIS